MKSKLLSITAAIGLLLGTTVLGYAQSSSQKNAPGQRMQDRGSVPGDPGASGYSPGDPMRDRGTKPVSPGASSYPPRPPASVTTRRRSMGARDPELEPRHAP